jgi:hypothetical protein
VYLTFLGEGEEEKDHLCTDITKYIEVSSKFISQKGYMKQVPY